jgi:mannose-6-phosphate isomerase-like protein (cupin superfamily)
MSYITNIIKKTEENTNFREVLFTGEKSQLVVMNIPIGGEIGEEMHSHVEQTLFFKQGSAKVILDGKETEVGVGDVVVVTPQTRHNIVNVGTEPLMIYTVYAPVNHIDGRIHKTKADADADVEDEDFGKEVTS